MADDGGALLVLSSCDDEERSAEMARTLVEEGLAACVHILPRGRSIYRWQGELCDEGEWMLLIKTRASSYAALERRLLALHPYEVPEVLAVPVTAASTSYLQWLFANT